MQLEKEICDKWNTLGVMPIIVDNNDWHYTKRIPSVPVYRRSACDRQIIEKPTALKDYMFSPGRYGNYYYGHIYVFASKDVKVNTPTTLK